MSDKDTTSEKIDFLDMREMHIIASQEVQDKRAKYRNGTRLSLSFTNTRIREIERQNQILVRKIFQQSPSPDIKKLETRGSVNEESNSAINRRKQNRQIGIDNKLLQQKLQLISQRKKKIYD